MDNMQINEIDVSHPPAAPRPQKGSSKLVRLTASLGQRRTVTVIGENLTLEAYIEILQEVVSKAQRAKSLKISIRTFMSMLRDQAQPDDVFGSDE